MTGVVDRVVIFVSPLMSVHDTHPVAPLAEMRHQSPFAWRDTRTVWPACNAQGDGTPFGTRDQAAIPLIRKKKSINIL